MNISNFFSAWSKLTPQQQQILQDAARLRSVTAGEMVHSGSAECIGLLLICSGRLRAYISSKDGREITLYRLLERDVCLFSACCTPGTFFEKPLFATLKTAFSKNMCRPSSTDGEREQQQMFCAVLN